MGINLSVVYPRDSLADREPQLPTIASITRGSYHVSPAWETIKIRSMISSECLSVLLHYDIEKLLK